MYYNRSLLSVELTAPILNINYLHNISYFKFSRVDLILVMNVKQVKQIKQKQGQPPEWELFCVDDKISMADDEPS